MEAATDILQIAGEDAVTIGRVAARAGISERTVHRHFESREALLQTIWDEVTDQISYPQTPRELVEHPRQAFPEWGQSPHFLRSRAFSPTALLAQRLALEPHESVRRSVQDRLPDLKEPHLARRIAIVKLIDSPTAKEWLWETCGLHSVEAGEAASEALEVLLGIRAADL